MKIRKIGERCFKTFIEAFLGSLVIMLPNTDLINKKVIYSILVGAISTGISAVLNLVLNYIDKKKIQNEETTNGKGD